MRIEQENPLETLFLPTSTFFPQQKNEKRGENLYRVKLSTAFDTVDRVKFLQIVKKKQFCTINLCTIKRFFRNNTLEIKRGKNFGTVFRITRGVPQGNALSRRLFTLYLDEAIREIIEKLGVKWNQTN